MARLNDWKNLAQSTVKGLDSRDATRLYEVEWPETLKSLTADSRDAIENEPGQFKRAIRTASAVMYGLLNRLSPQRRLLYALAVGMAILTALTVVAELHELSLRLAAGLALPTIFLTFLLALELIDKIRFRDELELARDLQKGLVPEQLPKLEHFDLAAYNSVANTVGGDIYDFVPLSDGRLAVLFGDASGHGMAAGLLMAVAHAAFRTQLDIDPEPEAIVGSLNRILCRTGGRRSFFTSCYLLVEPDGRYRACVSGHPPILHIRTDGALARKIGSGSYPLGIRPSLRWNVDEGRLEEGESLVLYSDGLPEARNRTDSPYGYERLDGVFAGAHRANASAVLAAALNDWRYHTSDARPDDDVSVAVIQRRSFA